MFLEITVTKNNRSFSNYKILNLGRMKFLLSFLFRASKPISWIQQNLNPKQFIIFSAILIGLTAGLAAVLLKLFVHFVAKNIGQISGENQLFIALCPLIGITLSVLFIRYFNR